MWVLVCDGCCCVCVWFVVWLWCLVFVFVLGWVGVLCCCLIFLILCVVFVLLVVGCALLFGLKFVLVASDLKLEPTKLRSQSCFVCFNMLLCAQYE